MLYGVGEVIDFLEVAVISVMCCGHVSCLWSVKIEEMLKMTAKENKINLGVGGVLAALANLAGLAGLARLAGMANLAGLAGLAGLANLVIRVIRS